MCCDSGRKPGSCCKNATEVFTLAAPFSSITAGPATPTTTITSTSRRSSNPAATTTTLSETVTPGLQSSIAPNATQIPPTAAPKSKTHNGAKIGTAIGGGVGGGIVLGAMALLWLWRRRRQRRKRRQQKKLKISRSFELPSDDHTFQPNSTLFPAELHPQASKLATHLAELEQKHSKLICDPVELEHKDSTTAAPASPAESMDKTVEEPVGPFELHGRQIDSIMVPPNRVKFDETRRWPFTRVQQGGNSRTRDETEQAGAGAKRPSLKRRPDSMSGPWHDSF